MTCSRKCWFLTLYFSVQGSGALHSFHVQPLSLPYCNKAPAKKHMKGRLPFAHVAHVRWFLVSSDCCSLLWAGSLVCAGSSTVDCITKDKCRGNWSKMCAVISELKKYQRDILPPVTAQPSHHASVVASIMEQHTAELTAAQEWDNEWNSQGLLSRLTPQARHFTLCSHIYVMSFSTQTLLVQHFSTS